MRWKLYFTVLAMILSLSAPATPAQSKDQNDSGQKAEAQEKENRLQFGGFQAGFGYSNYSRYYPFNGRFPYFLSPLYGYGPPYFHPMIQTVSLREAGRVKLKNMTRDAVVHINGGFAGIGKDLKSFYLKPGSYELSVQRYGYERIERKLYVLTDKSIEIVLQWKEEISP